MGDPKTESRQALGLSIRTIQPASLRPELARLVDPIRRNDARDEFGGGDIKAGVAGAAARIGHTDVRA